MSAPNARSQSTGNDQFLDQLVLEIGLMKEAVALAQEGAIEESIAMVGDEDEALTLVRAMSLAGNLRNIGRPELAGAIARRTIASVGEDWNVLEHDRRRAEVYMRKAELAWEFLGDRELASRYAYLSKRAVGALRGEELQSFERLDSLLESVEQSRRSFGGSDAEANKGGSSDELATTVFFPLCPNDHAL